MIVDNHKSSAFNTMIEVKIGNGFKKVHFIISSNLTRFLKIEEIYDAFIKESINSKDPLNNGEVIKNVDESFYFHETKFKNEDFWYDMLDKFRGLDKK